MSFFSGKRKSDKYPVRLKYTLQSFYKRTLFIYQKRICDFLIQNSLNFFFLNSLNFAKSHTVRAFASYKMALTIAITGKIGDGGTRTHVQNGLTYASTSVDIPLLN